MARKSTRILVSLYSLLWIKPVEIVGAPQGSGVGNNYSNLFKGDYSTVDWQKKYADLELRYKKLEEDMRLLQNEKDEKEHRWNFIKKFGASTFLIDMWKEKKDIED